MSFLPHSTIGKVTKTNPDSRRCSTGNVARTGRGRNDGGHLGDKLPHPGRVKTLSFELQILVHITAR